MPSIFAAQTAASTCPPGCAGHLPADDDVVHLSAEQTVIGTAGERSELYVSRELGPDGQVAVRLLGAGDAPLRPAEVRRLIDVLQAELAAAVAWEVS